MRKILPVEARANVRVRVRGSVIRVQVSEAVIRAVIRITANLKAAPIYNLCYSK